MIVQKKVKAAGREERSSTVGFKMKELLGDFGRTRLLFPFRQHEIVRPVLEQLIFLKQSDR